MQNDRDPQVLIVGGPNKPQTNPSWRTAAILKSWKILISSQPIDRFWRNLTCSWDSIIWTPLAKKLVILKIKDGGGGHLENSTKLQCLCYVWTSFEKIWHGDVSWSSRPPQHIKFKAYKNLTWWPIAIWKIKKHDISKNMCTYFSRILVCWCIIVLPSLTAIKCTVIDNKTATNKW